MNTKTQGEISEAIALAKLISFGFAVSIPFGDNQRYDLIVDDGSRLLKVQVKSGWFTNGCIVFAVASRNGFTGVRKTYDGEIDCFLVIHANRMFSVPVDTCGQSEIRLRVDQPNGGSKSNIRWARDYEITEHGQPLVSAE